MAVGSCGALWVVVGRVFVVCFGGGCWGSLPAVPAVGAACRCCQCAEVHPRRACRGCRLPWVQGNSRAGGGRRRAGGARHRQGRRADQGTEAQGGGPGGNTKGGINPRAFDFSVLRILVICEPFFAVFLWDICGWHFFGVEEVGIWAFFHGRRAFSESEGPEWAFCGVQAIAGAEFHDES